MDTKCGCCPPPFSPVGDPLAPGSGFFLRLQRPLVPQGGGLNHLQPPLRFSWPVFSLSYRLLRSGTGSRPSHYQPSQENALFYSPCEPLLPLVLIGFQPHPSSPICHFYPLALAHLVAIHSAVAWSVQAEAVQVETQFLLPQRLPWLLISGGVNTTPDTPHLFAAVLLGSGSSLHAPWTPCSLELALHSCQPGEGGGSPCRPPMTSGIMALSGALATLPTGSSVLKAAAAPPAGFSAPPAPAPAGCSGRTVSGRGWALLLTFLSAYLLGGVDGGQEPPPPDT